MENKKEFTKQLENLLVFDNDRNDVESCKYDRKPNLEVVEIKYRGGYTVRINVTANSQGAILKEVAREVYGDGAMGAFFHGFPGEEAAV